MGITTKTGDKGKTSLYCGKRVYKDHPRIDICGSLDEISSYLGVAKNASGDKNTKRVIHYVQKELILLGTELATTSVGSGKIKKHVNKDSICVLEKEIDYVEGKNVIKVKSFCIPGNGTASSALDVARAITRRAERRSVTLFRKGMIKNPHLVTYLNRLSDLLYLLARSEEEKR